MKVPLFWMKSLLVRENVRGVVAEVEERFRRVRAEVEGLEAILRTLRSYAYNDDDELSAPDQRTGLDKRDSSASKSAALDRVARFLLEGGRVKLDPEKSRARRCSYALADPLGERMAKQLSKTPRP